MNERITAAVTICSSFYGEVFGLGLMVRAAGRFSTCKGYPVGFPDASEIERRHPAIAILPDQTARYSLAHDRPVTVSPAGLYSQPTHPSYVV